MRIRILLAVTGASLVGCSSKGSKTKHVEAEQ